MEFNSLTTETQLKWTRVHPEPNRYDFGAADKLVGFAERHHMQVRGQALLWGTSVYGYSGVPDYVRKADPDQMRRLVADHIRTVVGRYRGRVNRWDIVNEPLQPFGTQLDDTLIEKLSSVRVPNDLLAIGSSGPTIVSAEAAA